MTRVAAVIAICAALLLGQDSSSNTRNKLVFISDIHLNLDANYSWMVNHTGDLSQFLTDLNSRGDVAELVILGDLVDDWVNPVGNLPQTFSGVLAAGINSGVVSALQAVCANPNIQVTYVVGNHDMFSFDPANKALLTSTFPGMTIVADYPGLGAYAKDNVIWAEHGHRYCLFNAPDIWSRPGGHLPMGYFISRLAASEAADTGVVTTTPDLLNEFILAPGATGDGLFSDLIIRGIFDGIAIRSGIPLTDSFIMNSKDSYVPDPLVEDVASTYDTIYSGWPSRQDRVSNVEAVWHDVGHLGSAANLLFEMPDHIKDKYPFTPRIVLF